MQRPSLPRTPSLRDTASQFWCGRVLVKAHSGSSSRMLMGANVRSPERTLPALEAAHIRPYAEGGSHEPTNGLLLRRDIHALFDLGYVTVTPDLRFEVSKRIREEFENGRHYYAYHGQRVEGPLNKDWRPDSAALAWHNEARFR